MIRVKAGAPSAARTLVASWTKGRACRMPGRCPQWIRRTLTLGLPTAWGALAMLYKLTCPLAQQSDMGARIVSSAVFFTIGTALVLHVRRALLRELRQVRKVAGAAQNVLLRPLPPRMDGLALAAGRLCADRGAMVGGDLYEVMATEHGVRVVMGDVRGHGLSALGTVAALLGSFREAAHDEPDLASVLRRLERAMARHLRERARAEHPSSGLGASPGCGTPGATEPDGPVAEEFVTVLLLEIRRDGEIVALNCGHPWPYVLRGGGERAVGSVGPERATAGAAEAVSGCVGPVAGAGGCVEPVADGEPMPPLGPFPLPDELPVQRCGRLLPGEVLFLHTDGVEDARDAAGRFFPLRTVLTEAVQAGQVAPQAVIRSVYARLLQYTRGGPADDAALLVMRNERKHAPSHRGSGPSTSGPPTSWPASSGQPDSGTRTSDESPAGPAASEVPASAEPPVHRPASGEPAGSR
ncbi:PP2C family protein-serine/threonine phosphatase [Streptomyces himalayensis]